MFDGFDVSVGQGNVASEFHTAKNSTEGVSVTRRRSVVGRTQLPHRSLDTPYNPLT